MEIQKKRGYLYTYSWFTLLYSRNTTLQSNSTPILKLQYFGHLMRRAYSLEKTMMLGKIEGRRRREQRMSWLDGITDSMDMSLSKFQETVKNRKAYRAAVHEVPKSQTWPSDWTTTLQWKLIFKVKINWNYIEIVSQPGEGGLLVLLCTWLW